MAAATKGNVATASVKGSFVRLLPTGAPWAGAGEPDFDTPGHIIEAAIEAMRRDPRQPHIRRGQERDIPAPEPPLAKKNPPPWRQSLFPFQPTSTK